MAPKPIDWTQLWYPGPKRAFTADEMRRAGSDGPSRTMLAIAAVNVAMLSLLLLQLAPPEQAARQLGAVVALLVMGAAAARC